MMSNKDILKKRGQPSENSLESEFADKKKTECCKVTS